MAFILTYYLPQFVFIGDNFKTLLVTLLYTWGGNGNALSNSFFWLAETKLQVLWFFPPVSRIEPRTLPLFCTSRATTTKAKKAKPILLTTIIAKAVKWAKIFYCNIRNSVSNDNNSKKVSSDSNCNATTNDKNNGTSNNSRFCFSFLWLLSLDYKWCNN